MEEPTIEYIQERPNEDGDWEKVNCFLWRNPPEEMAIVYAAHALRGKYLKTAEKTHENYIHKEPTQVDGQKMTMKYGTAAEDLASPLLEGMRAPCTAPESLPEIQERLWRGSQWELKKDQGIQALASIGWLANVTKARPPAITQESTTIQYEESLLPTSMSVSEEVRASGYNEAQAAILEEARNLAANALEKCGKLAGRMRELRVGAFGELVFRTQARLFGALPDPDTEERAKFEAMIAAAEEKREEEE
jgi:hypothetical protein